MAPRHEHVRPHKRKGFWYLIRRVPHEFAAYDDRRIVYLATGIRILDDPRGFKAQQAVEQLDGELMRYWADKRAGRDPDAEARYARARPTAQELGFAYAPAAEAVTLPITDILRRIETLEARKSVDKAAEIVSVLGGEPPPAIMVDSMVEEFCAIFTPRRRRREGAQSCGFQIRARRQGRSVQRPDQGSHRASSSRARLVVSAKAQQLAWP